MTKNILLSISFFVLTLFPTQLYAQEVNSRVQAELAQILRVIVQAVNNGNTQTIIEGISENARPELADEIQRALNNEPIEYTLHTDKITANDDLTYTIKGSFEARGISENDVNWELSGIPIQFTFENYNGGWWLKETNFHQRLGSSFTLKFVGFIFALVGGIILFGGLFIYWKKRKHKTETLNRSV